MRCIAALVLLLGGAVANSAELVSSNYQFGDLRLQYLPPANDGGEPITKYKIEWDASNDNVSLPPFSPSSQNFGSAEVENVREEQEIIVSCRSACEGTFSLSWGGRVIDDSLPVDATADDVQLALSKLFEPFSVYADGTSPIRVTRKANGFAFKWKVAFLGISGDVGMIQADGDLLVGSGANVKVVEVTKGASDLYPGAYTNEIQTVSVRRRTGFGCESLSGSFSLSFEGEATVAVDVDATAADFKSALEDLPTIHTVNVHTDHHVSTGAGDCASRSWIVTFTHLVHENRQGAGDIGLLRLSSSSLTDPTISRVDVFENVKGTNPRAFNIRGLEHGLTYHCRVSAYNSLGYGVSSSTVTAVPKIQPSPPIGPFVSIPDELSSADDLGTSLSVSWNAVEDDGGDAVSEYKLEWYSSLDNLEVQKLTTSAADGITEVQSVTISADTDGITGFFTLTFDGETTELISHDAEADGEESVEMKLERLSTVGDVEVSRDYSWTSIPALKFDLSSGSNVLSRVGGSYAGTLAELFDVGHLILVGEEVHTVSSVGSTFLMTNDSYSGPSASSVTIHSWSFGYEWHVTFASHIGKQPLLEASPSNNWAGTNPVIEVARIQEGLQPLSGSVRLGFEGERTLPIPFDADAPLVKQALESLASIGEVDVSRFRNNNGHNYFITFISELGDREQITVDDAKLMGPDAQARVATLIDGTEPSNYGSELIASPQSGSSLMKHELNDLENGVPYFVRLRSRNSKGLGYASFAGPSPLAPMKAPKSPTSVSMFPLSESYIRVSWQAPLETGGASIIKYAVQWDTDASFPNAWLEGYFFKEDVNQNDDPGIVYCHTFSIDPTSSDEPRYARVLAFNGYQWSDDADAPVLSTLADVGTPGPVIGFDAFPTSNIGMMLSWSHPEINDEESCDYAGDGGSPITHYLVEYDEVADFSSPATSVVVPSSSTDLRIGGRDVLSGFESTILKEGGTYYARITPFNSVGSGSSETFQSAIGPLADTEPSAPIIRSARAASASSVLVEWDTPTFDGGSVIQEYVVEYDSNSTFQSTPKNITIPIVSEVKALQVESSEFDLNVHTIRATVQVTNEVQSIKTEASGVDEVQEISTTCDDVVAEVQMITTTAVDTDEEQLVSLISDDVDEIQLVRLQGDNRVEVQSVHVSVPRVNEVQKFGVVISNINTDGDGIHSTACSGIPVGDPCPDIENALSGSFTVSFDFDDCGSNGVNYCQLALSQYDPGLGMVACSPGLVNDPFSGGDHCVSQPVAHSYSSLEGDAGTLQRALNDLVDDNGVSFMTSSNVPGKQEAVTVTRTGRIKTKGSCTLDAGGSDPATCMGEYELLYEIEFDAVHSSGDVPPVTVVTSDFRLDTTSTSYVNSMCPPAYFVDGCETPVGAALDSDHGSFYNGEADSVAIESTKGAQPTGMITLDYECESSVTSLPVGNQMTVSADGLSASFDSVGFVGNMALGQWIRFNAGDGLDHYRKIVDADSSTESVTFDSSAPVNGATYADVEFGYYYSDWNESDGISGVSSHCQGSRTHATLPIAVDTFNAAMSETDWNGKIGAMSVIDSSGIDVSRSLVSDLSSNIGLVWDVTFQKQPGNVHEMACTSVSGTNQCSVSTLQESSIISGDFKLQTTWPHEYVSETPQMYETGNVSWNADAQSLKAALEAVTDTNDDKVFGSVDVSRSPFVPSSHSRWSGGYLWTITFTSRGGNIPALTFDDLSLTGLNPLLEVSDEDSGVSDLHQGIRNSATFSADDPGLARDGNQISGSFGLSWSGNAYHDPVVTADVFTVQTGGSAGDQYTALSASGFKALFEEHVLGNSVDQVDVIRSQYPTQAMGYTYTVLFRHEDVGGDVLPLTYQVSSPLGGTNSYVRVEENAKGTELVGTFQLRFQGETTRPINHDATAADVQEALNELNSIAPSAVVVSGGENPIRPGPSDGAGGMSTQVGGRIWYVTFASNVWQDPTVVHESSFVPGNWVGPPALYSESWSSGFSKAWGKNVGNVPMISCIETGLSTTNGALPDGGCSVSELVAGTDPLGGSFKICLDSASIPNNVMSVESDSCTDFIVHNAVASANESGGDGSSVEEKLEQLDNVGDVLVTRSAVNPRNGGYTWKVQFLHDADGPCDQKDDIASLCNSPGDVPKLCNDGSATPCDTSSLTGTCLKPGSCSKLAALDATDKLNGVGFPGGNERQVVLVKDIEYAGWDDGSVVDASSITKQYKLLINGVATECINHNALAEEMRSSIQDVLDGGAGGSVRIDRTRSEDLAPNGFYYNIVFYDTGDISPLTASFADGACADDFEPSQSVVVVPWIDGSLHPETCSDCVDGIVQRGDFVTWESAGEGLVGTLAWNADTADVKTHLEQSGDREVDITRTVLDKYGTIEWVVTFAKNAGSTPPGSGDIDLLTVTQDNDTAGRSASVVVNEITKGSESLSGTFDLDYLSSGGPRTFSFDESPQRMLRKLEEMSTIGQVFVTRHCHPSCSLGGWGGVAVTPGAVGGYEWTIYFLKNPGSNLGFTFPPGSGTVDPPSIDHSLLAGNDATVIVDIPSGGSGALTGTFVLETEGAQSEPIPYNVDATALENAINDLSVGSVNVLSGSRKSHLIEGITASVVRDGTLASLTGDDIREHLAPGESFRLGGSTEIDGAENVGTATLTPRSPILSSVQLDSSRDQLSVGETVRVGADVYSIVKSGVEVQQIAVQRASGIPDGDFYQLRVTIEGADETTECLAFDASASDVESTLNSLSVLLDNGGVQVTKTDTTTGFTGDAHFYKVYFLGDELVGDVEEMVVEECTLGIPPGVDSTNSHVYVRTLINGGGTEHQRVVLSSDSGITGDTPAFSLSISDSNANSWDSPCYEWGVSSLDIASSIDSDAFSSGTLVVHSVADLGGGRFQVTSTSFVEGVVLVGDFVNPGNVCPGRVSSIGDDGKSFTTESSGCTSVPGDTIYVANDIDIVDSLTDNGWSVSELTVVTAYSDEEVPESNIDGLYKISVEFEGVSRSTSCLPYGASVYDIQQEIGLLFDYNKDGSIDAADADHVSIEREGDGTSASGYGYTYKFLSNGSSSSIGASGVLGSNAPKFDVVDVGSDGGCIDLTSGGTPRFSVEIAREGVDEYVYDLFFTGSHWRNVPQIEVNTFGDGVCAAGGVDIVDGMNRNIGVKTVADGGGALDSESDRYVLNKAVRPDLGGTHDLYVIPPTLTIQNESSEIQRIVIMDDENNAIWGSGSPTFKLSYEGESTGCLPRDVLEEDLESALNSLTSLCPGVEPCATVTRSEDSILAPNGFLYNVYFDSFAAARQDVSELVADTSHVDCLAFDDAGGEKVSIDTISQGANAAELSSVQLPLTSRWPGESKTNLPIYRTSGTYWLVRFEQSLGNVAMSLDATGLSSNSQASIEENFFDSVNHNSVVIPGLDTGIEYSARVFSRTDFGFSQPSDAVPAIPSGRPGKVSNLAAGHALHQQEVQSLTIAATHQKEVQSITTSAMAISEVQEITLEGMPGSDMSTYYFSLRHPEIQTVKWSSGSPVTAGSFFLKLSYVDRANSNIAGSVIYKEMKTPCISFDASADDVKRAMETNAVENGLADDSVRITRSGNRSFSSHYGFSYDIHFVGSDVRGNVLELTSDIALSGLDSSGGNTCEAFVSSTNDAALEITTQNDSQALGTDTPRAELLIDTNVAIVDGEFQLSVTHFGQQLTTACIPWDATADEMESALENLANVDSVRVDRTDSAVLSGDGSSVSYTVYFDGNAMHTDGNDSSGFMPSQGSNFEVTDPDGCKPLKAYHNNVLRDVSLIPDSIASIIVVSAFDGEHNLQTASSQAISSAITASLPMMVSDVQTTQSIETPDNDLTFTMTFGEDDGNIALLVCNQPPSSTTSFSCGTSTVMDGNEIRGHFYLESSDPIPYDASPAIMEAALSGVAGIGCVEVSRSQPTGQAGFTWLVTFSEPHGDVANLVPSNSLTGKSASVSVMEVTKGNEIGGTFTLSYGSETTDPLAFDVSVEVLEASLEELDGFDHVDVNSNGDIDSELGRSFSVTFLDYDAGDMLSLGADATQLTGLGASMSVDEVVKGSLATKDSLSLSFDLPHGCSTSNVGQEECGNPVSEVSIELSPTSDFTGAAVSYQYIPNYSTQIIRTSNSGEGGLSGYFNVAYDGALSAPINARATSDEVRDALEGLPGIETASVEMQVLSGGYEWTCNINVAGQGIAKPLSTPAHHMMPHDATLIIGTTDCDKCIYAKDLSSVPYYIRARARNDNGWSDYSDVVSKTPRAIPTPPTDVRVEAISGECLEVSFQPPVYGEPLVSFVVQWDYSDTFVNAEDESLSSCSSLRFGSCAVSSIGPSPVRHEICGLAELEEYYVRVAATNEIPAQSIYPLGTPRDNTMWSGKYPAVPVYQAPDAPTSLDARALSHDGVQIRFDWPVRDGGKAITELIVMYSTQEDFSVSHQASIPPSLPELIPGSSSGTSYVFDFVPTTPPLATGMTYNFKLIAVNEIGNGDPSQAVQTVPSGPPDRPTAASLTTPQSSEMPVTEATVAWSAPASTGGYPIESYVVEWWSQEKRPEIQVVRLLYSSSLSDTTFTLSLSPSPTVKRETSNLPWNAPADLVRRELLNLGYDEDNDLLLINDVKVTRSTLANGFQWTLTFGDNPDRSFNDGDLVSLSGSVMENGDAGSPTISVSTTQDGRRSGGMDEVQFLQVMGTGTLSGHYRIKFSGSEWTSLIPVHASASYIKNALKQLSTVGEVDVVQNDGVDQSVIGTPGNLVHHYEVSFMSSSGNVAALVVDSAHLASTNGDATVAVYDGNNALDSLNTKDSAAFPGELPVHYGNSGILDPTVDTFQITGLITGMEYFVAVSARNSMHGLGERLLPSPASITPPLQNPGSPQSVSLDVNTGYSDSLIVSFDEPESTGGSDVLFYRVELDPTSTFDSPIVQDISCPAGNRQTEWEVSTSADGGGVINGGSFRLDVEVDGFTSVTYDIPYDAVALSSNETGIVEELIPNFSTTSGSNAVTTIPPVTIEGIVFPGDKLRFSGQISPYKYFEVQSVSGTGAVLTEVFAGDDGVQVSTTRHYGGRGSPLSSRIHCQYDEDLCPSDSESRSGSLQSKLEDLSLAIQEGVFVDRDGPNAHNGFVWRITFLDDARSSADFTVRVNSNSLTTFGGVGSAHVSASLMNSGQTYTTCTGTHVVPTYGGLVKGLEYHVRVSARNSEGYSLPIKAPEPVSPKVIPGAPTGATLDVVSATELRVIFGSPSDNGGSAITQYLVELSTTSDFAEVATSSTLDYLDGGSPFFKNVGGLTTGTHYFARIRAKNSQGYGISQMTTPSSLNPHQKPSPPTNVRLGITSNTMLTIGWDPPLSDGGDSISKYRVEWDTKASFASSSYAPNKGFVDVDPSTLSHTVQLLSSQKSYHFRVYASNLAGSSVAQLATPSSATPSLQVPGKPHSIQAVPGSSVGTAEISWQRPRIPAHDIPCYNEGVTIKECPTPYGGSLPASDGGEDIIEYEVEYNERSDFLGGDGGRNLYTGTHAVLTNLYTGRTYFVRVLARNAVGSGKYSDAVAVIVI